MRQHCEACDDFDIPLHASSDGRVTTATKAVPNPKKRKASQSAGSWKTQSTNGLNYTTWSVTNVVRSLSPSLPGTEVRERSQSQSLWSSSRTRQSPESYSNSHPEPATEATSKSTSRSPSLPSGRGRSPQSHPETPQPYPETPQSAIRPAEEEPLSRHETQREGKREREKKPRNVLASERFMRYAPKGNRWHERQLELGLKRVEEYEKVVQGFLHHSHARSDSEHIKDHGRGGSDSELIAVAKKMANITKSSLDNAKLQKSFGLFQLLILLSYYESLRHSGIPHHIYLAQSERSSSHDDWPPSFAIDLMAACIVIAMDTGKYL